MLKLSLILILIFTLFSLSTNARRVELCEDVGERVRESSVLEDYRGRNVLLAFSGIHCSGCATRLLRLTEVSRQFHIDALVITAPGETREDLQRAAQLYPKLRFEAAPCSPCEFDYLLDTNSSKIFVLDSCARLLHRYARSAEHLTQLRAKFPLTHSCGASCSASERRKRDPVDLPPVGCGPKKQVTAVLIAETPFDIRLQMLPQTNNQQSAPYTTVTQAPSTSTTQKNRQYKQIFQPSSGQQQQTGQATKQQYQPVPQPVVSVAYNGQTQPQYDNRFAPIQTQPVQQQHVDQVVQQRQQTPRYQEQVYSTANKPGTRVQGRYQKYQPDQFTVTTTVEPRNPATNRYNIERLEEQRRVLAKQREEHARRLKLQQERLQNQGSQTAPTTQLETPPTNEQQPQDTVSFTHAFRNQNLQSSPAEDGEEEKQRPPVTTTPAPRPSTTRRPPKTTKNPLVYANQPSQGNFGRRTYGRQPYESTYQMQQRRRNELAAQRQRVIQEKQRVELEQLQRQELQRQITEQAARQAAAQAAYDQKLSSTKTEAAPLYHDDNGDVAETVDLADYYEDVDEWTTAIPQVRLESPPSPEPLPENPADHPEFLFDLPCNGFSDEICYQQQTQLEPQEVHKCCQTKIVLTDQCVPGRCSNVTNQLCCIQKLLQSKFKCCNDKHQGEVLFAGDSFSRCCYDNFVDEEDPCCPQSYSSHQWRSIYELCLPAVNVDLSRVRVPQKVVAGLSTTVNFDFSKTDKWRFECKYGSHVPQYSYFPPLTTEESENGQTEDN